MEQDSKNSFADRASAAHLLANRLSAYPYSNSVIMAIPRGGVTLGYHLANLLHLPLDLIMCKKIGHPYNKELAIGSVCAEGEATCTSTDVPPGYLHDEVRRIQDSLKSRYDQFMRGRHPVEVKGKNVIVVDDGIATGHTMLACIRFLRQKSPAKIIIAVPVASGSALRKLRKEADEVICLLSPHSFFAVGQFYEDFSEVTDDMVIQMLNRHFRESEERSPRV